MTIQTNVNIVYSQFFTVGCLKNYRICRSCVVFILSSTVNKSRGDSIGTPLGFHGFGRVATFLLIGPLITIGNLLTCC